MTVFIMFYPILVHFMKFASFKSRPLLRSLTLKASVTTAADDSLEYFFIVFQRK